MPVDLQKDSYKLSAAVAPVPGLSTACSLAVEIIKASQTSERNKLRLQGLAHSVTDHLVSIGRCMRGRINNYPVEVQEDLEELERILRDVGNVVTKYSLLSLQKSLITAGERDKDIAELLTLLQNVQRSISMKLLTGVKATPKGAKYPPGLGTTFNYHVGPTVDRPQTVDNYRHYLGLTTNRPQTVAEPRERADVVNQAHPWLPASPRKHALNGLPFPHFGNKKDDTSLPRVHTKLASNNLSFDLSGRITPVDTRVGSPRGSDRPASRKLLHPFKRSATPNLTEYIKGIHQTSYSGGYGEIYTGELTSSRGPERVALKVIRTMNDGRSIAKSKKSFRREVSIWCSLRHPYVLPFYGVCECDDARLFMASPWAEGGKSLEYLRRNPFTNRGHLLYQTALALEYLHSGKHTASIIHGDLKADNLLISRTGDALLCDFGLAHFVEERSSSSGSSSAGNLKGTPRYMAPELLVTPESTPQSSKPTKESDVFAFGLLMLEIYTEKEPFSHLREIEAIMKLGKGEVPTRPIEPTVSQRGLNNLVWALISDCWKSHPCRRPIMKDVAWRILWAVKR